MRVDVVSIFPALFDAVSAAGITGRALERGLWSLHRWDPREYTTDNYRRVDDRPYGGGPGMVMMAAPLARTLDAVQQAQDVPRKQSADHRDATKPPVILLSPHGRRFDHGAARRLAQLPAFTLICGRYEAVDQRFVDARVDEEISIGDFVVSGGELPAMLVIDAAVRLLPGAVNDPESVEQESFVTGLLDCPQYTRPEAWSGDAVPDVLLSGDHARIARWRRDAALRLTAARRPDLIDALRRTGGLSAEDIRTLKSARP